MAISLTYSFTSGTRILSSQVNSNFSTLATRALDKTGDTMTGNLLFTDATYDIGASGATRPRDLFLSRTALVGTALVVGTADTSGIRLDLESGALAVREGDDSAYGDLLVNDLTIGGGDLIASANLVIRRNTSDGSDSGKLALTGGGSGSFTRATLQSQGAGIYLFGNENVDTGGTGRIELLPGNVAGSGIYAYRSDGTEMLSLVGGDGSATLTASNSDASVWSWQFTNSNASSPIGMRVSYSAAAPNGTSNPFFIGRDSSTNRFELRSNGGLANYQANDVNLSDETSKKSFTPIDMAAVWDAHKAMRDVWTLFRYKDQSHSDPNMGYTAQGVQKAFAEAAPWIVDDSWEGQLCVYDHDLKNFTGAVVTELQHRIEELTARVEKLELS